MEAPNMRFCGTDPKVFTVICDASIALHRPVLPRKRWPVIRFKNKRAITWQEHQKSLAGENHPEWRAYYELPWNLGGSQTDVARLIAEDIDWEDHSIAVHRA
jgi:hypothetical protein